MLEVIEGLRNTGMEGNVRIEILTPKCQRSGICQLIGTAGVVFHQDRSVVQARSINEVDHKSVNTMLEARKSAKQRRFDVIKYIIPISVVCQVNRVYAEPNLSLR